MANYLSLTHGTSRGQETYGYNMVTLTDQDTGKRFRAMGGGYDMEGTVVGEWLTAACQAELAALAPRVYYTHTADGTVRKTDESSTLYGLSMRADGTLSVDGACGINSVRKIAEAAGVNLTRTWNRKGHTTGYVVED